MSSADQQGGEAAGAGPVPAEALNAPDRYAVRSRRDLLAILGALARTAAPIELQIEQLDAVLTTRLLSVKPEFEELVFDGSALLGLNKLDGRGGLTARVQLDTIWYHFRAPHVERFHSEGRAAFRARLPVEISRMQRRDAMRYPVPAVNSPVCDVPAVAGANRAIRLRVLDVSTSGFAATLDTPDPSLKPDAVLTGCRFHLPGIGSIESDLVLAYLSPARDGMPLRMGFRFSNLLVGSLEHLRRYILRLERAHLETISKS